jgi:hypothetical protein
MPVYFGPLGLEVHREAKLARAIAYLRTPQKHGHQQNIYVLDVEAWQDKNRMKGWSRGHKWAFLARGAGIVDIPAELAILAA